MGRPLLVYVVVAIELFFSILAFPSGYILVSDPSGRSMGLDFARSYLPIIKDFFIVGIFLIVAYGVAPLAIIYGLLRGKRWAYFSGLGLGVVAILWILVEVFTMYEVGFIFFQPLIIGLGALEILLLTRRNVKAYLGIK